MTGGPEKTSARRAHSREDLGVSVCGLDGDDPLCRRRYPARIRAPQPWPQYLWPFDKFKRGEVEKTQDSRRDDLLKSVPA